MPTKLEKILAKIIFFSSSLLLLVPLLVTKKAFAPYIQPKFLAILVLSEIAFLAYLCLGYLNKKFRPQFNWLTVAVLIYSLVLVVTSVTGLSFNRSFWGDLERSEGVYLMLHLVFWFLALSFVIRKDETWRKILAFNAWASLAVCLLGLMQYFGLNPFQLFIIDANSRIFSTLGNASFLATYSLLSGFLALYLFSKNNGQKKWLFLSIAILNFIAVFLTATRGAYLGLAAGAVLYLALNLKNRLYKQNSIHRWLMISVGLGIVLISLVFVFKNSAFVQNNYYLSRVAGINLQAATVETRLLSWQAGLEGFKNNWLLGVGPENFNLTFDRYFDSAIYQHTGQEIWFSRAHNKLIDQAVMSGIFGLLAYGAIFAVIFYYLFKLAKNQPERKTEWLILTLAWTVYFVQNLFLFDSLSSFILFFLLLALTNYLWLNRQPEKSNNNALEQPADPVQKNPVWPGLIALVILAGLSLVNLTFFRANRSLAKSIDAYQTGNFKKFNENFQRAVENSINPSQYVTQYATKLVELIIIIGDSKIPEEDLKNSFNKLLSYFDELDKVDPDNLINNYQKTKVYLFLGEIEKNDDYLEKAREAIERSKTLSPGNIRPYWQEFQLYDLKKDFEKQQLALAKAIELAPYTPDSYWLMAIMYFNQKNDAKAWEFADQAVDLDYNFRLTQDLYKLYQHYFTAEDWHRLLRILGQLMTLEKKNPDFYFAAADVYLKLGEKENAIIVLKKLLEEDPSLTDDVATAINQIRNNQYEIE